MLSFSPQSTCVGVDFSLCFHCNTCGLMQNRLHPINALFVKLNKPSRLCILSTKTLAKKFHALMQTTLIESVVPFHLVLNIIFPFVFGKTQY